MPTPKQRANLRRGGAPATPDAAARAREGKAIHRQEEEAAMARVEVAADQSPQEVIHTLFLEASRAATLAYQRYNRGRPGAGPEKGLLDLSKETRMLADRLFEILQSQGVEGEVAEFLGTLEERWRVLEGAEPLPPEPRRDPIPRSES